jgi:pSer/pThr/pTyr-binding forkhead associated (FHA) protein
MQVKIKLLKGSSKDKEVKIPVPSCLIGREPDCHLRPQSDAVSRKHCEIASTDKEVVIRDLKSRNGVYVNGVKVDGEAVLLTGDQVRIGPLEFEMIIEHAGSKIKHSKVTDVKEAIARTIDKAGSNSDLGNVSRWLEESDAANRSSSAASETRQLRLDDTAVPAPKPSETIPETKIEEPVAGKPDKKEPGKLPPRPVVQAKNSRDAAADMLKRLFKK